MEKENASEQEKDKNENEELKALTEQDFLKSDDPKKIITDLTNKIFLLEKAIKNKE